MQVTIENPAQQKSIRIKLPKTDRELTEDMETIGITSVIPKAVLADVSPEDLALLRLKGTEANVDELNFLARRMETLTDYERKKLAACCEAKRADSLKDMINLAYNLDGVSLIDDYTDIEAIGRRIYLDRHIISNPKYMEDVNLGQYAREYMEQKPGKSTVYGTLLPGDFDIREAYDGKVLPYFFYDEKTSVCVGIQNAYGLEENLYLPTDIHSMNKAKARLGVTWFSDCKVTEIYNKKLERIHPSMNVENIKDLTQLNELCRVVYDFDDDQMERLRMAVEFAGADDTLAITGLAKNLDSFEILAGIHNDHDYGKFIVEESGLFKVDELLTCIDYESLARDKRASTLAQSGYVEGGFVGTAKDIEEILDYKGNPNEPLEPEERLLTFCLFSPLQAACYEKGHDAEPALLDGRDLVEHKNEIRERIEMVGRLLFSREKNRGLMAYMRGGKILDAKVESAFPAVGEYNGTLYGVLDCRLKTALSREEVGMLKEAWQGQMSDGWGEEFEQREIEVGDGSLYVSFWHGGKGYSVQTESELKGTGETGQEIGWGMELTM